MRRLLYYLYERRLLQQVLAPPMPRHVGIILDGNRRFAKQRGLTENRSVPGLGDRTEVTPTAPGCLDVPTS